MFEIRDFHKNVYVDGNILFDSEKKVSYTDVIAFSTIKKEDCKNLIKTDKIFQDNGQDFHSITNELINEDDVIYHAAGNVVSYGLEKKLSNPYNCIFTYNRNLFDMNVILKSSVDKNTVFGNTDISAVSIYRTLNSLSSVNRMLFQSILSNYELFAMNILITCYLRFERVKDLFLTNNQFKGMSDKEVVLKLRTSHYNNFKNTVHYLFTTILDIHLPDFSYLIKAYDKRNNLAHRYFTTKYGEALVIKDCELRELVIETNKFVYELFEKVIDKVYNS